MTTMMIIIDFIVYALYTGSIDGIRRFTDLGTEVGRQKRSKELMNWARKKRRMIRREDLLEYLAGKSPPRSLNQRLNLSLILFS